jgi:hypothetical protein
MEGASLLWETRIAARVAEAEADAAGSAPDYPKPTGNMDGSAHSGAFCSRRADQEHADR